MQRSAQETNFTPTDPLQSSFQSSASQPEFFGAPLHMNESGDIDQLFQQSPTPYHPYAMPYFGSPTALATPDPYFQVSLLYLPICPVMSKPSMDEHCYLSSSIYTSLRQESPYSPSYYTLETQLTINAAASTERSRHPGSYRPSPPIPLQLAFLVNQYQRARYRQPTRPPLSIPRLQFPTFFSSWPKFPHSTARSSAST